MSFLTPERVPVEVYKWDDVDAPMLDKTAGCVATIFKACLITGYGSKSSAGWTMPFEDNTAGIKVFRPALNARTDFYLRLTADNGSSIVPQIYTDMTDANTGNLRLQCSTAFTYGGLNGANKWLMIASPYGVWFFYNRYTNETTQLANQTGVFLHAGLTVSAANNDSALILMHTGGSNVNYATGIARRKIHASQFWTQPRSYKTAPSSAADLDVLTFFDGVTAHSNAVHTAGACYTQNEQLFKLSGGVTTSAPQTLSNMQILQDEVLGSCIAHGAATFEPEMWLIGTEYWEY